nr:MAG TPA: hypothetical protein [Caudoviricetes sp.]
MLSSKDERKDDFQFLISSRGHLMTPGVFSNMTKRRRRERW